MFLNLGKNAATIAALFRIKYLPCQEKAQAAGAVFNDTISMYYQRTFCSSSACAAIFCLYCRHYVLWGIVRAAYFM